ncbi:MAG: T9SS type A sorting domain-containing protein [Flavobacteriales bacterium]|nr:T9SS type A sorting domain-containing protein [Flavobacteriales bacterium]
MYYYQNRTLHLVLSLFLLSLSFVSEAQDLRCGTMERLEYECKDNHNLLQKRNTINKAIKEWKKNSSTPNSYTIPVVFHVIYKNQDEYVSFEQIMSQLDVLNQDFNRTNSDANQTPSEFLDVAADCNISFCLAQRTENNDTTSGITYTQTSVSSFSLYDNRIFQDSLGGKTIWNSSDYLNIYVCDLTNALGFSSFPGGNPNRDAVVVDFSNFGTIDIAPPFNKGRTATHELGHWLDLYHIWGPGNCGSDEVDDTPSQETENYGCPSHPSPTCDNNGDMFQNYMDYTNDACMNLFTNGQKERMHATLNTERLGIGNADFCQLPYEDIGINNNVQPSENEIYCGENLELITSLFNYSENTITKASIFYQIDDDNPIEYEWSGNLNPNTSQEINLGNITFSTGEHTLKIYSSSPNSFRDINPTNDTTFLTFTITQGTNIDFVIQTDNYAEENYWAILNNQNDTILSENELVSNEINSFNYCQDLDSCYTLVIYDIYEDGMCCDFGNGYVSVNGQNFSGNFGSELQIDLCNTIDINEVKEINSVLVYPNPTNDYITVESKTSIELIRIYDLYGKNLVQKNCHSNKELVNLYPLSSGAYFLQLITNKQTHSVKIIKK